mmetsp:Transcript_118321/g.314896  ORF Transcript_118321/g.314896 Transcript_118321/m.314896 type:complete len:228 (+) Transcript_118321:703-1386(+)
MVKVKTLLPLENDGAILIVSRLGHSAVLKVAEICVEALDMRNTDTADLAAVEPLEAVIRKCPTKALSILWHLKIDERIAHVAAVVHVHRQIEEIISTPKANFVDLLQEGGLRVLVGDVPKHHGGDSAIRHAVACMGLQVLRPWDYLGMVRLEVPLRVGRAVVICAALARPRRRPLGCSWECGRRWLPPLPCAVQHLVQREGNLVVLQVHAIAWADLHGCCHRRGAAH